MTSRYQTIAIEPLAPSKPVFGAPCNGCGVCCLAQPCPTGMVLSQRRHGTCMALRWDREQSAYRCGAITQPLPVLLEAMPPWMRRAAPLLAPLLAAYARRSIALNAGCDSTLEIEDDARSDV